MENLTPQQRQQAVQQAAMQVNQQLMQDIMKKSIETCFSKCATSSGDRLDKREQSCLGYCQDLYLETRAQVQQALAERQQKL